MFPPIWLRLGCPSCRLAYIGSSTSLSMRGLPEPSIPNESDSIPRKCFEYWSTASCGSVIPCFSAQARASLYRGDPLGNPRPLALAFTSESGKSSPGLTPCKRIPFVRSLPLRAIARAETASPIPIVIVLRPSIRPMTSSQNWSNPAPLLTFCWYADRAISRAARISWSARSFRWAC